MKKEEAGTAQTGVGYLHSSEETPVMGVERREVGRASADEASRELGDGPTGLATPIHPAADERVRKLQRTLYQCAKKNPKWKAWSLYGELCKREILEEAFWQVARNGGAPGVDGENIRTLANDAELRERFLDGLKKELQNKTYRCNAIRRVWIPKANGKKRPLGIPTVKDRVVQTAVTILLIPIFEVDFHDNSYAYRPGRNAQQAIDKIREAVISGRHEIVDADLSGYFDTIPHAKIIKLIKGRVTDGSILKLIKEWLRAPIEESEYGKKSRKINRCGTPQGGVISPLLANIYLDGLDKAVNMGKQLQAIMIRYADDFVILCRRGTGAEVKKRLQQWLGKRELKLNEEKTQILDIQKDNLGFLGFKIELRRSWKSGEYYPHTEPSEKSCKKLRDNIRKHTAPGTRNQATEEVFGNINRCLKGWIGYFHYANSSNVFSKMQEFVNQRMKSWLWRKCGQTRSKFTINNQTLYERYGLTKFPMYAKWKQPAHR